MGLEQPETRGVVAEGRFSAWLVQKDAYALRVARYIILNPIRAGLCTHPGQWRWSSYRATAGLEPAPPFLTISWLLDLLSPDRAEAQRRYAAFVEEGIGAELGLEAVGDLYRGTSEFAAATHPPPPHSDEHPTRQRHAARPPLHQLLPTGSDTEIGAAVHHHRYRLVEVARHLRIHPTTDTRRLKLHESSISDVAKREEARPDP